MIKALVFDMDGVLYDTEKVSLRNWMKIADEMGLPDMESTHTKCIGVNRNDGIHILKDCYGEEFDGEAFLDHASRLMHEGWEKDGLPLMKGVIEILTYLKEKNIPVAICSSTRVPTILQHLKQTDMEEYFTEIIGGNMVEHSKPQPDIYLKACETLGFKPEECIGVEDSPNGIRSCHAAGLFTVMIPDLVQPTEELLSLCDRKEESLLTLLDYIRTIWG